MEKKKTRWNRKEDRWERKREDRNGEKGKDRIGWKTKWERKREDRNGEKEDKAG